MSQDVTPVVVGRDVDRIQFHVGASVSVKPHSDSPLVLMRKGGRIPAPMNRRTADKLVTTEQGVYAYFADDNLEMLYNWTNILSVVFA